MTFIIINYKSKKTSKFRFFILIKKKKKLFKIVNEITNLSPSSASKYIVKSNKMKKNLNLKLTKT